MGIVTLSISDCIDSKALADMKIVITFHTNGNTFVSFVIYLQLDSQCLTFHCSSSFCVHSLSTPRTSTPPATIQMTTRQQEMFRAMTRSRTLRAVGRDMHVFPIISYKIINEIDSRLSNS
jgi:hypothetical protein